MLGLSVCHRSVCIDAKGVAIYRSLWNAAAGNRGLLDSPAVCDQLTFRKYLYLGERENPINARQLDANIPGRLGLLLLNGGGEGSNAQDYQWKQGIHCLMISSAYQ